MVYVRDVQETVLIFVFIVDASHESGGRWQDLIDKDEDGLLGAELDSLSDHVDELTDCQVCGDEVLLLVDGSDVGFLDLFADDLDGVLAIVARGRQIGRRRLLECGRHTSGVCGRPLPCASRACARP